MVSEASSIRLRLLFGNGGISELELSSAAQAVARKRFSVQKIAKTKSEPYGAQQVEISFGGEYECLVKENGALKEKLRQEDIKLRVSQNYAEPTYHRLHFCRLL